MVEAEVRAWGTGYHQAPTLRDSDRRHGALQPFGGLPSTSTSIFSPLSFFRIFTPYSALASRPSPSGVPGKLQSAIEMLVEFVDDMVKDT